MELEVFNERTTNIYVSLHSNAKISLDDAIKNNEGRFYKTMTSIIFSAFTIEAYCNHILKNNEENWKGLERLPPFVKLEELYKSYGIKFDKSKRPIQSIKTMFDFRNMMAHGKTETNNDSKKLKKDILSISQSDLLDLSKTKWEEINSLKNAEIIFEDMEKIIRLINSVIEKNEDPFICSIELNGKIRTL